MAGLKLVATSTKLSFSTSTLTLLTVTAPTNQRLKIHGWQISFDGVSNTAQPIQTQLLRVSTAGTLTSNTPVKLNTSNAETIQSTSGRLATAEPTAGNVLDDQQIHAQTGYAMLYPVDFMPEVPGGGIISIRLVAPGAGADATAEILYEE